uniref:Uncharacterized protein n=1 Tax=Arundo donax TaxID=35708 RepID=A0A0A9CC33_ARUDO
MSCRSKQSLMLFKTIILRPTCYLAAVPSSYKIIC